MIETIGGKTPKVAPTAYVHPSALLAGDVEVGSGSIVFPGAVVRGDSGRVRIGRNSLIEDNCVLLASRLLHSEGGYEALLEIGDDVTMGHGAVILGRKVGKNTLIGINSTVHHGVEVGHSCVVAAGTVLAAGTKVPNSTVFAGVPGRSKGMVGGRMLFWTEARSEMRQEIHQTILDNFKQKKSPKISKTAYVHPSVCLVGDVEIDEGAILFPGSVLRGDFGPIKIGRNAVIQSNCVIHSGDPKDLQEGRLSSSEIGDQAFVGHGTVINGNRVGSGTWIGANSYVLHGADIGKNCVVAPGSGVMGGAQVPAESCVSSHGTSASEKSNIHSDESFRKSAILMRELLLNSPPGKPCLPASSSVHPMAHLVGDVEIGEGSSVGCGAVVLGHMNSVQIGKNVSIGSNCVLDASNHLDRSSSLIIEDNVVMEPCAIVECKRIGRDTIIGTRSAVLGQTPIDACTVVEAGVVIE